jgi:hypothetical protein
VTDGAAEDWKIAATVAIYVWESEQRANRKTITDRAREIHAALAEGPAAARGAGPVGRGECESVQLAWTPEPAGETAAQLGMLAPMVSPGFPSPE